MTFGHFIVKNAFRNKRRTFLTVLSTGFSLFLLITLQTLVGYLFNPPQPEKGELRLAVNRATSVFDGLPLGLMSKLEKVPHVVGVMPFQFYMGGLKDQPKKVFPSIAVQPDRFWQMFPELNLVEGTRERFVELKTAAIIGTELAKAYGFKIGDRISLVGTAIPVDLDFELVGIYKAPQYSTTMFFNLKYLQDGLEGMNTVNTYWLMADSADSVAGIMESVDTMNRNSPHETRTETERNFVLGFMKMLGNVKFLVGSISLVVAFTMLIVAASNMAMTIRERTREIAILKSIGYPAHLVLILILGEAVFLSVLSGVISCSAAWGMGHMSLYAATSGMIERFVVKGPTYGIALGGGAAIGLLSALAPAIHASRMSILEAFRRLD